MNKPSLGVVMIVKNEEQNLGAILGDLQGIVDEICVVDTGSTDGTIAIAESCGARIGHFAWINDFAAARNHSIAMAESDYLLWLDADDRIDEGQRSLITALKAHLRPEKDRAYMLKILSSAANEPDSISYQTRIFPNREGVRFEGRVHEQLLPALQKYGIGVESVDITIRHTGYHDPGDRPAKARRNLEILLEELRDGKDTANQNFFIALSYISLGENGECLAYIERARAKRTDEDWYHISFIIAAECLLRLRRADEAYQETSRGAGLFPDSPLMHFCHGDVCMQCGRYEEAVQVFEKAEVLPPRVDSYPAPPDLATRILLFKGKALAKCGRMHEAVDVFKRTLKAGVLQAELQYELGLGLLQSGRVDEALPYLEQARALAVDVDKALWLASARVYAFLERHEQAHHLYLDVFIKDRKDLDAASGLIQTSIPLDDVDGLLAGLESIMESLSMQTDLELNSPAEIAEMCAQVARRLYDQDAMNRSYANRLAQAALAIDAVCVRAHLLIVDINLAAGQQDVALKHLEQATRAGAPMAEIEGRMERLAAR